MNYTPTIGLEIHVGLDTKTKMFCDSPNDHDEKHPNVNICPVCMGHPGTLPTINEEAIKKLLMVGTALNCKIAEFSKFDRKNYFYPDLPKGYQISQYDLPVCGEGYLDIPTNVERLKTKANSKSEDGVSPSSLDLRRIRITRIHMEEDAGKLLHPAGANYTLVDYNRAGVPLMELVTEPDLKGAEDVRQFATELQLILRYLGASGANMEKGEMRVEVNLSMASSGGELGTKVEVKNINSISAAGRAVEYEIKRQTEMLENGEKIIQETRGWDEDKGKTVSQRLKEGSADYRYFPEPDLPPMRFPANTVDDVRAALPELPQTRRERFSKEYSLPVADVEVLTVNKELGNWFEYVASEIGEWEHLTHLERVADEHKPRLYKLAANYLITELQKLLGGDWDLNGLKLTPENFAEFVVRVHNGEVSSSAAQTLLAEMFATGKNVADIIQEMDLAQVSDESSLVDAVERVIASNSKAVEDYKKGKTDSIKFLIGQAMRETKGKANPEVLAEIFKKNLD